MIERFVVILDRILLWLRLPDTPPMTRLRCLGLLGNSFPVSVLRFLLIDETKELAAGHTLEAKRASVF